MSNVPLRGTDALDILRLMGKTKRRRMLKVQLRTWAIGFKFFQRVSETVAKQVNKAMRAVEDSMINAIAKISNPVTSDFQSAMPATTWWIQGTHFQLTPLEIARIVAFECVTMRLLKSLTKL